MVQSVNGGGDAGGLTFPGKITVITSSPSQLQNEEEYWAAEQLVEKYGSDKVIHVTWPAFALHDREQIYAVFSALTVDRDVKALVINQALPGVNTAVDKLKRIRDDIFVVYCTIHGSPSDAAARADLLLMTNELGSAPLMVKQAKKQGAKTFIHYSFPRHISQELQSGRRDLIREVCAAEGIQFVDATVMDPQEDNYNALQFVIDDVQRMVSKYGEDTAFFCTSCFLQVPLIHAITDCHAIFPQPCCPSPYHGFPEALGIDMNENGMPALDYMISESKRIAAAKNMAGRLSTWPSSVSMMITYAGAEYAIKWIKGQAPKSGIDDKMLLDCMKTYIKGASGEDTGVYMTSYSEGGRTYDNFKLLLMDYLDY